MDVLEVHDDEVNVQEIMDQIQKRIEERKKSGVYSEEVEELLREDISQLNKEPESFVDSFDELGYALQQANSHWHVTGSYPILSRHRFLAPFLVLGKRLIRLLVRTYVDVIVQQQNKFNSSVVRSLNTVNKILEKQSDSHLTHFNYYAFEEAHRKDEPVKQVQSSFFPYFKGCENVLDIGCGRGVFLEFLKDSGIGARGIDTDENMVLHCQNKGLKVELSDALCYLESLDDESLDGIFAGQVIEHLAANDLIQLAMTAYRKLGQGSYFIAETMNPQCLAVLSQFLVDPSHIKPVHPELMRFVLDLAGFRNIEFKYFSPYPDDIRLKPITVDESLPQSQVLSSQILNENIEKLNRTIYGYQDYAVIAVK